MLKEYPAKRPKGDPQRRWFADEFFDLIAWLNPDGSIKGFQLCYDKGPAERALTWTREAGYAHNRIDDGEGNPAKNQTPVLVPDGAFASRKILQRFMDACGQIDARISRFVIRKLREYPGK